jgi:hypothetical protein
MALSLMISSSSNHMVMQKVKNDDNVLLMPALKLCLLYVAAGTACWPIIVLVLQGAWLLLEMPLLSSTAADRIATSCATVVLALWLTHLRGYCSTSLPIPSNRS